MLSRKEIHEIIRQAHGTTAYHKFSQLTHYPVATDGVIAVAEAAECYTQTTLKQSDKAESKSSKQGRTLRSRFFNQDQKGSISLSSGL